MYQKDPVVFNSLGDLNDSWLNEHKNHILIWFKHTVFENTTGTQYDECRCYTCTGFARKEIQKVSISPEIKPRPEKRYKMRPMNQKYLGQ